ncbi:GNAT family N-acetyltransferase [Arenimonas caeni]|jgi:predicted GNAT family N-acyltransferase|uniref:GNAT family N-acetyltransferase n=1 Tax=Arenimonas caeni TaxID=2058085 RepID=A0A2P6M7Z5_9GAMM|nr:GNAT family N-acetyltransferase [Arenimonas caeni]MDY0021383.1 GNAT family N-acetyltransferase [Arenimonas caeni]PRH82100.1 GNAT family N-acetyltransferase [Arenimonas caeni]
MIPTDFRIEPADYATDLADLRSVRETVFILEQKVPEEEEWDELDPKSHHVLARDERGRPIGTGRLTPERKIGRMAVLPEWRGKGVGDALLVALLDKARSLGWTEVTLNAQCSAEGFYAKHGFVPYGDRFMEAGIEHRAMRRELEPLAGPERYPARARAPSVRSSEFDSLSAATEATLALVGSARRALWLFSRDLDPVLYSQPAVIEAFKQFAISGRGGVVQVLLLDPAAVQGQGHPLLGLAQRMTSVFQFRTPTDDVDLQYPSAFLANDADGYLFRQLGSRWEGDWSPANPARTRQLAEHFGRVWERSRPCTEFRALGI